MMKRRTTAERIAIPLEGNPTTQFYTKKGLLLARGYTRIVIGGRGPYIEFDSEQIVEENIYIPEHALHKLESNFSYYHEYRSKDDCFVKLYDQKMEVSYADYKVGMWYISPEEVKTDEVDELFLPPYPDPEVPQEDEGDGDSLFDL